MARHFTAQNKMLIAATSHLTSSTQLRISALSWWNRMTFLRPIQCHLKLVIICILRLIKTGINSYMHMWTYSVHHQLESEAWAVTTWWRLGMELKWNKTFYMALECTDGWKALTDSWMAFQMTGGEWEKVLWPMVRLAWGTVMRSWLLDGVIW